VINPQPSTALQPYTTSQKAQSKIAGTKTSKSRRRRYPAVVAQVKNATARIATREIPAILEQAESSISTYSISASS